MPSDLLELRGITKQFGGITALADVDLTLRHGHILALLGENGAGKSTLMKILAGVHHPDRGSLRLDGTELRLRRPQDAQAAGIGIIHQEFSLVPHLDVVENLFLGREQRTRWGACDRSAMERDATTVLRRLGADLPLRAPVVKLSVAAQQFVEIAKALLHRSRVLILDEPTATLTTAETERLFRVMRELKSAGVSLIFISHHLEEIFAIADDVACLRDGRLVGERPIANCIAGELIRLIVGRDVAQVYPVKADARAGETLLEVRRLQRRHNLPSVRFEIRRGEILGIAGLVGSGRTRMMRALLGVDRVAHREVWRRGSPLVLRSPADALCAGIGFVPEDRQREGLVLSASVQDNVLLTCLRRACHLRWGFIRQRIGEELTRERVNELRVKTASLATPVRHLSGGNQQKIVLAKWLGARCDVLVFDEPTRGVDVGAKTEIHQLMRRLADAGKAIVMISSDLPEALGLSDRLMVMRDQRIVHVFDRGERVTAEEVMHYATGGRDA